MSSPCNPPNGRTLLNRSALARVLVFGMCVLALAPPGALAATATGTTGAAIVITVKDDVITLSSASAKAGVVQFTLVNGDRADHEIDIVRTTFDATRLPVKANGQFSERARGVKVVKEAVRIKAGATRAFTARLTPGTYVLADNLPGHYRAGERVNFTVS